MPFAVAAGIGAVGVVAASAMQSSAANKASKRAADAQRDAQSSAQASQEAMYAENVARQAPWVQQGENALLRVSDLAGANGAEAATTAMGDFRTSPGYQFAVDEGMRAIENSAAREGILNSGATAKALQQRGQNLASLDFQAYYSRLANLASLGQNAAAGVGNNGTQVAGSIANGMLSTGAGVAQTQMSNGAAQASIYGNAAQGLGNIANTAGNNYMYQQGLQQQPNALGPQASAWGGSGQAVPTTAGYAANAPFAGY